jgi:hypothetical protein
MEHTENGIWGGGRLADSSGFQNLKSKTFLSPIKAQSNSQFTFVLHTFLSDSYCQLVHQYHIPNYRKLFYLCNKEEYFILNTVLMPYNYQQMCY